jgi:hypothetical protein
LPANAVKCAIGPDESQITFRDLGENQTVDGGFEKHVARVEAHPDDRRLFEYDPVKGSGQHNGTSGLPRALQLLNNLVRHAKDAEIVLRLSRVFAALEREEVIDFLVE